MILGPDYLIATTIYAFVWGAVWGSFLNVVIWRLPRGQNLARPASHCPTCEQAIRWYDNIPIASWLLLRGRCRHCETRISPRYPAVELLCALVSAALWWKVANPHIGLEPFQTLLVPYLFLFYFSLVLVAIAFIDFDLMIIPHELTLPTMAAGLAYALLSPKSGSWVTFFPATDIVDSAIGFVAGGAIIFVIFRGYMLVTGREGMGGGDFTMTAMIGAFLGWQSLLFVLFAASMQGLLFVACVAVYERVRGGEPGDAGSLLVQGAHRPEFWEDEQSTDGGGERADDRARAAGEPGETADRDAELSALEGDAVLAVTREASSQDDADPAADDAFMLLAVPFGPFLALAALEYIFVGEYALRWLTAGAWP